MAAAAQGTVLVYGGAGALGTVAVRNFTKAGFVSSSASTQQANEEEGRTRKKKEEEERKKEEEGTMSIECSDFFSHVLSWSLQEDDEQRRRSRRGKYGEPVGLTQKRKKIRKKKEEEGEGGRQDDCRVQRVF